MKRETHSKFTHSIIEYKLIVKWSDGENENLCEHLPEYLKKELERYFLEMDDLRTENPDEYEVTK